MARKKPTRSTKKSAKNICKTEMKCNSGGMGYCLGVLGAAIYYVSTATTFWMGVVGILKAFVWPAFLVFELMKFLGM